VTNKPTLNRVGQSVLLPHKSEEIERTPSLKRVSEVAVTVVDFDDDDEPMNSPFRQSKTFDNSKEDSSLQIPVQTEEDLLFEKLESNFVSDESLLKDDTSGLRLSTNVLEGLDDEPMLTHECLDDDDEMLI